MALIEGISPTAAKTLVDELAAQYPVAKLQEALQNVLSAAGTDLVGKLKGLTVTVTIKVE